jgi:hypothetical protein
MRKWPVTASGSAMDNEHINQIGSQLSDLAARTGALRGYL